MIQQEKKENKLRKRLYRKNQKRKGDKKNLKNNNKLKENNQS